MITDKEDRSKMTQESKLTSVAQGKLSYICCVLTFMASQLT